MLIAAPRRLLTVLLVLALLLHGRYQAWASGPTGAAPVAHADTASTTASAPIRFWLLANDGAAGASLDPTTVNLMPTTPGLVRKRVSIANEGVFWVSPTGIITFVPAAGFMGRTQITYSVRDAAGHTSAPAVVVVYVWPAPAPPTAPQLNLLTATRH